MSGTNIVDIIHPSHIDIGLATLEMAKPVSFNSLKNKILKQLWLHRLSWGVIVSDNFR